ncbi:MAG: hypothetical protein ACPIOQ_17140, partial [Promethearchaeia archaeon]
MGKEYSIAAGEVFTFSFKVRNGQTTQASRDLYASASGLYCIKNLCTIASDESTDLTMTNPVKFDVAKKIIEIKEPTFETAALYQSTSDPGAKATITVSLKPNNDISGSSAEITIKGLCGTTVNSDVTLLDMNENPINTYTSPSIVNIASTASWDKAGSTFKFKLGTVGPAADKVHVFKFKWELVETSNDACPVTISATNADTNFASMAMTGAVGKVDAPQFTTFKIGQISTRPDAMNLVCITLETNFDFKSKTAGVNKESTITLTGLTGSQLSGEAGDKLYACPTNSMQAGSNDFNLPEKTGWAAPVTPKNYPALSGPSVPFQPSGGDQGTYDFTESTGTAIFTADTIGLKKGQEYTFAILVKNSKTASDCKTVTLAAKGDITQTVTMKSPGYARALIDGEKDGDACPLMVYAPGFLTKIVSSSNKIAEANTVVTVTLRSNVDIVSERDGFKSSITISGLTGSKTSDSTTISDILVETTANEYGNVPTAFSPKFDDLKWTGSSGVLALELAHTGDGKCLHPSGASARTQSQLCMKAGVEYEFQFKLTNGNTAQAAPAVSIEVAYESGKQAKQAIDPPMSVGCNSELPLKILPKDQILCKHKVGQLVTAPGATNAICVTLASHVELATTTAGNADRFVAFTVTGLKGFGTD